MSFRVYYKAYDTSNSEFIESDEVNHTVLVLVDGANVNTFESGPTDRGNGLYEVVVSDANIPQGSRFALQGASSSPNVSLFGESGVRPEATKSNVRSWVGGRWTDETGATFDLTITDIPE